MDGLNRAEAMSRGPPRWPIPTTTAPSAPPTLATATMTCQSAPAEAPTARIKWGSAEPTVSAAMISPIATPRSRRNQPAIIRRAIGYTAARPAPVNARHTSADVAPSARRANPRLATPATIAPATNNVRLGMTSAAPVRARTIAAAAKPTCTATVSSGRSSPLVFHSAASNGLTAEALNHGPNARRTPAPTMPSSRQRPSGSRSRPLVSPPRPAATPAAGLEPLEAVHRQHEDRRAADLDLERIGHEELTRLHD